MAYFDYLILGINQAKTCAQLTDALTKAQAELNDASSGINQEISLIAPLLNPPTDLPGLVTWAAAITNQYIGANTKLAAKLTDIETKMTEALSAATDRANELGCSPPEGK